MGSLDNLTTTKEDIKNWIYALQVQPDGTHHNSSTGKSRLRLIEPDMPASHPPLKSAIRSSVASVGALGSSAKREDAVATTTPRTSP